MCDCGKHARRRQRLLEKKGVNIYTEKNRTTVCPPFRGQHNLLCMPLLTRFCAAAHFATLIWSTNLCYSKRVTRQKNAPRTFGLGFILPLQKQKMRGLLKQGKVALALLRQRLSKSFERKAYIISNWDDPPFLS